MDEMTEKQEEATRIIEAIGTTTLNECYVPVINQVCDCEKHLTQFPEGWRCTVCWEWWYH
jgi:hypothetical protein